MQNNNKENKSLQPKKSNAEEIKEKKYRQNFDLEKDKYPEYASLSPYHRECLIATNYWRVMNGQNIIEVPVFNWR